MVVLLLGAAIGIGAANVVVYSRYKKYVSETHDIINKMNHDADMALKRVNSIGSLESVQNYISSINKDNTK